MSDTEIIRSIANELALNFSNPNDPRLFERINRLKEKFRSLSKAGSTKLLVRLGFDQKDNELSKKFHHRLATESRTELLLILNKKMSAVVIPSIPTEQLNLDRRNSLPISENTRFEKALENIHKIISSNSEISKTSRHVCLCWLDKIRQSNMDDRIIEWSNICPHESGAIGAAMVVGPCPIPGAFRPSQTEIQNTFKSVEDVETEGNDIGMFTYMKSSIVIAFELTSLPLDNLFNDISEMKTAKDKLNKWANSAIGGSNAMGPEYLAIKNWIMSKETEINSLYSCS